MLKKGGKPVNPKKRQAKAKKPSLKVMDNHDLEGLLGTVDRPPEAKMVLLASLKKDNKTPQLLSFGMGPSDIQWHLEKEGIADQVFHITNQYAEEDPLVVKTLTSPSGRKWYICYGPNPTAIMKVFKEFLNGQSEKKDEGPVSNKHAMIREFLKQVWETIDYWVKEKQTGATPEELRDAISSTVFSILAMLDGSQVSIPGFKVIPVLESDKDTKDMVESGFWEIHWTEEDIGGSLHELFYPSDPRVTGFPSSSQPTKSTGELQEDPTTRILSEKRIRQIVENVIKDNPALDGLMDRLNQYEVKVTHL